MADAVEPARQDVQQEPADELVRCQGHGAVPFGTVTAVVLEAERHPARIERDQPAVGDRDPVRVARQIGKHRLRPRKWRFGVDHPRLVAHERDAVPERPRVGKPGLPAEEP